nr:acyltransferase [Marinicella sp. W31]MDC2878228.1 acyltransferase [Marinicella sp. W31]
MTWERTAEDIDAPAHRARCAGLAENAGAVIDPTAYIAEMAFIFTERLVFGAASYIAGYAVVRGDITIGADCSVNAYACLAGKVSCGDHVRIASHVQIMGFNHGYDDPDVPISQQPHESRGVVIEDDVWIGANVVVLDGVRIGRGAVIAAGATVTRDIPPLMIAGGVPAKPIRRRGEKRVAPGADIDAALGEVGDRIKAEWRTILAKNMRDGVYVSREADGAERPSMRHLCDAVEIAAGLDDQPEGLDTAAAIMTLKAVQDPETGLFPIPASRRNLTGRSAMTGWHSTMSFRSVTRWKCSAAGLNTGSPQSNALRRSSAPGWKVFPGTTMPGARVRRSMRSGPQSISTRAIFRLAFPPTARARSCSVGSRSMLTERPGFGARRRRRKGCCRRSTGSTA